MGAGWWAALWQLKIISAAGYLLHYLLPRCRPTSHRRLDRHEQREVHAQHSGHAGTPKAVEDGHRLGSCHTMFARSLAWQAGGSGVESDGHLLDGAERSTPKLLLALAAGVALGIACSRVL